MRKKKRTNYWRGFPDELKYMLLAHVRGTGNYCVRGIILWLKDRIDYCDSFMFETDIYDVIRWITEVMDMCLYPLEQAEELWEQYKEDIRTILEKEEELLNRIAPKDISCGFKPAYERNGYFKIVEHTQKLNVFFSTLYMYTGETDKLKERLDLVVQDSIRNVQNLLVSNKAMELASIDDWTEYHFPGSDSYETANWLTREFLPDYEARKALADSYGSYVLFLKTYDPMENKEALEHLQSKAEKRLMYLCEYILEEIDDLISYDEEPVENYMKDQEKYEKIFEAVKQGNLTDVLKPIEIKYNYWDLPF